MDPLKTLRKESTRQTRKKVKSADTSGCRQRNDDYIYDVKVLKPSYLKSNANPILCKGGGVSSTYTSIISVVMILFSKGQRF